MSVSWPVPGPGQWALDRSHMPAGTTPLVQHIAQSSMPQGMRRMFRDLGAPLDSLDVRFVNGNFYSRLRPLISPDRPARKLPPRVVLRLVTRLHPEMRRRNRTAAAVLRDEPWVAVIADWHSSMKPRIVAENLRLQHVDLTQLDDAGVAAHVSTCLTHCIASWETHFWLHGYDLGPLGRYLHEAQHWDVEVGTLLSLLEGASPSTSAPTAQLAAIREAVAATGVEPASLAELRALSPEIDAMVGQYLEHRGAVLFSRYDVDGTTLGEQPDLILASIRNAVVRDTSAIVAERIAAVRARVPAEHRDNFDVRLRQAREAMDLRDDNGPTTAEWPLGLLRLALLEIGRRWAASGFVDDPSLALELHADELASALHSPPSAAQLVQRSHDRRAQKLLSAPPLLGDAELAPPPDVLPPALCELVSMVQIVMAQLGMDGDVDAGDQLRGSGIGTATVRGRARIAATPEDALNSLEPGDVLVVTGTTPAYNLVLSLSAAVVTQEGGPMSHAAVIARELGIPAVIGVAGALTHIPDGALIDVDPVAGEVRVVG
jgi:rifampicin phosphotransferase